MPLVLQGRSQLHPHPVSRPHCGSSCQGKQVRLLSTAFGTPPRADPEVVQQHGCTPLLDWITLLEPLGTLKEVLHEEGNLPSPFMLKACQIPFPPLLPPSLPPSSTCPGCFPHCPRSRGIFTSASVHSSCTVFTKNWAGLTQDRDNGSAFPCLLLWEPTSLPIAAVTLPVKPSPLAVQLQGAGAALKHPLHPGQQRKQQQLDEEGMKGKEMDCASEHREEGRDTYLSRSTIYQHQCVEVEEPGSGGAATHAVQVAASTCPLPNPGSAPDPSLPVQAPPLPRRGCLWMQEGEIGPLLSLTPADTIFAVFCKAPTAGMTPENNKMF